MNIFCSVSFALPIHTVLIRYNKGFSDRTWEVTNHRSQSVRAAWAAQSYYGLIVADLVCWAGGLWGWKEVELAGINVCKDPIPLFLHAHTHQTYTSYMGSMERLVTIFWFTFSRPSGCPFPPSDAVYSLVAQLHHVNWGRIGLWH